MAVVNIYRTLSQRTVVFTALHCLVDSDVKNNYFWSLQMMTQNNKIYIIKKYNLAHVVPSLYIFNWYMEMLVVRLILITVYFPLG